MRTMENSLAFSAVWPQPPRASSQKWLHVRKPTIRSGKLCHTTKAKSTWGDTEVRYEEGLPDQPGTSRDMEARPARPRDSGEDVRA